MKLVCPNCGAQYAVDDQMIPASGRDVQCSNCTHTWFQPPADQDPDLADELGYALEDMAEPPPVAAPAPTPDDQSTEPETSPEAPEQDEPPRPARRARDDRVFNVLREEAAREQAAREAEAKAALESQPELDITPPPPAPRSAQDFEDAPPPREVGDTQLVDHSEEAQIAAAASLAGKAAARRDLLPDIEEINSTLTPEAPASEEQAILTAADENARRRQKGGFRIGFTLVAIIAVLGLGLYLHAPRVAAIVPGSEPALRSYVDLVDKGRFWLDQTIIGALDQS